MATSAFDIEIDDFTLAGAKRGDMAACEKIYRLYQKPVFTVAIRVCRCRELAQEVMQEAFITAFRRIGQFRGDAPFWGWLRRVAINHAISALRKQPKVDFIPFEDYQSWQPGEQGQIGEKEVNKPADVMRALREWDSGDTIKMEIKRERKNKTLNVILPERKLGMDFVPFDGEWEFSFQTSDD